MDKQLKEILSELHSGLKNLLGNNLMDIYLFGSRARGDHHEDSDIDVLVVLREDFNYFDMVVRTSELTSELSLKHNVVISEEFVTQSQYENERSPLIINARKDGVLI